MASLGGLLVAVLHLQAASRTDAFRSFISLVPNGARVVTLTGELCPGFGHALCTGRGGYNQFGRDFLAAGDRWTAAVCRTKSFGGSKTNGQLFGDPSCTWSAGMPDPPCPAGGCVAGSMVAGPSVEDQTDLAGVLGFIFAVMVLSVLGAVLARVRLVRLAALLYKPGPKSWSLANSLGVVMVSGAMVAFTAAVAVKRDAYGQNSILGLAAGLAASLPIWWSFFKVGVHSIFGMSREAAWRIHIAFGFLALVFGTVHGAIALVISALNRMAIIGLAGLALMWLGVLPMVLPELKVITYDQFKKLHVLSAIGYILTFVHMVMAAHDNEALTATIVAALNGVALGALVVQLVYLGATYRTATVESAEVLTERTGQHIFMSLNVKGFKHAPGQWGLN